MARIYIQLDDESSKLFSELDSKGKAEFNKTMNLFAKEYLSPELMKRKKSEQMLEAMMGTVEWRQM